MSDPALLEAAAIALKDLVTKVAAANKLKCKMKLKTKDGRVFIKTPPPPPSLFEVAEGAVESAGQALGEGEDQAEPVEEEPEDPEFEAGASWFKKAEVVGFEADSKEEEKEVEPEEPEFDVFAMLPNDISAEALGEWKKKKKEEYEANKKRIIARKEAFSACTAYNKALFHVRQMLMASTLKGVSAAGGLNMAIKEIQARVKEAGCAAVDWVKCIKIDFEGLLDGKLEFDIDFSSIMNKAPPALRKVLELTLTIVNALKLLAQKTFVTLNKALESGNALAELVKKYGQNPSALTSLADGLGPMEIMKMPFVIKGNVSNFSNVPDILMQLLTSIKLTVTEINDAFHGVYAIGTSKDANAAGERRVLSEKH